MTEGGELFEEGMRDPDADVWHWLELTQDDFEDLQRWGELISAEEIAGRILQRLAREQWEIEQGIEAARPTSRVMVRDARHRLEYAD